MHNIFIYFNLCIHKKTNGIRLKILTVMESLIIAYDKNMHWIYPDLNSVLSKKFHFLWNGPEAYSCHISEKVNWFCLTGVSLFVTLSWCKCSKVYTGNLCLMPLWPQFWSFQSNPEWYMPPIFMVTQCIHCMVIHTYWCQVPLWLQLEDATGMCNFCSCWPNIFSGHNCSW